MPENAITTISEDLKIGSNQAVVKAKSMVITDNQTNQEATDFLKTLKKFQTEIRSELRPGIEKAHETHKHLVDQEKRLLAPLQEAERVLKRSISDFLVRMERERQEQQRKEREKAEAAERKRKEELEMQAQAHEAKGNTEKAEERRQQAEEVFVPAPIVDSKIEKQEGVSIKVNWKFEVLDMSKLPLKYLKPDEVAIGQVVRALKDKSDIPGVRIWSESGISVKSKR